jgi:thiol-disulfide isomerase/thioredoxin
MTRQRTLAVVLAAAAMLVASSSFAAGTRGKGKPSPAKPKIGAAAPDWSGIPGVDGKKHGLADYKKAKFVVLAFTCNHCPVAKAYEDRLIAIQKEYKSKGVQVIAVCVNDAEAYPEDSFENMKQRAAGKDLGGWRTNKTPFNFPYLRDDTQKIARDYAATVTPHIFVLDPKRKLVYMGGVDDNDNPKNGKEHWLHDALDAVLKGKEPPKAVTQQRGCTIKWKKKK